MHLAYLAKKEAEVEMADIVHQFPINAPARSVFHGIATPAGLDTWWCKSSSGNPATGEIYRLYFGPDYDWKAIVSKCVLDKYFELTMTEADYDWMGTRVGFVLTDQGNSTDVQFCHADWKAANEHYRISSFCWAMYLRILKRNLEFGEEVAYEDRLAV